MPLVLQEVECMQIVMIPARGHDTRPMAGIMSTLGPPPPPMGVPRPQAGPGTTRGGAPEAPPCAVPICYPWHCVITATPAMSLPCHCCHCSAAGTVARRWGPHSLLPLRHTACCP